MITLVYDVVQEDDRVSVTAVVEDVRLIYPATRFEPEEYGPGLCKAFFYLGDDEILPTDDEELIEFLECLDLDWELIAED